MEGMSAWKHVESLSQQSTLADLAPSIRLNNNTPVKMHSEMLNRQNLIMRVALLVSDVLYV